MNYHTQALTYSTLPQKSVGIEKHAFKNACLIKEHFTVPVLYSLHNVSLTITKRLNETSPVTNVLEEGPLDRLFRNVHKFHHRPYRYRWSWWHIVLVMLTRLKKVLFSVKIYLQSSGYTAKNMLKKITFKTKYGFKNSRVCQQILTALHYCHGYKTFRFAYNF
jgi:hypothetical protein